MSSYRLSNGDFIKKSVIDARVRKAKEQKVNSQLEEFGYSFCESCGISSGTYLDCSHTESVKSCQENGRSEKAYSVDNLRILCRTCHSEYDSNCLMFSKK